MTESITENTVVTLYDVAGVQMAQWYGYRLPEWLGGILARTHNNGFPMFPNHNAAMTYHIRWGETGMAEVIYGRELPIALQITLIRYATVRED